MHAKRLFFLFCLTNLAFLHLVAQPKLISADPYSTSSLQQAMAYIDSIKTLPASASWPNIKTSLFLKNLHDNVYMPLSFYAGNGTNFCGYGALTYLLIQDDPLGYLRLMVELYTTGSGTYGKVHFTPSAAIMQAAGKLRYKGIMDIHPADQMWCLALADHFKGYINVFNPNYDPGDENTMWAAVNYAKFNRMVSKLLHYKIHARGSDLMHPWISDTYGYIKEKLKTGIVVLYINNRVLHKKKQEKIKVGIPTHYIILKDITETPEGLTMLYWDYGGKTIRQLSAAFLHKITFGISVCTKTKVNENP